jgi:hypothetical protein
MRLPVRVDACRCDYRKVEVDCRVASAPRSLLDKRPVCPVAGRLWTLINLDNGRECTILPKLHGGLFRLLQFSSSLPVDNQ